MKWVRSARRTGVWQKGRNLHEQLCKSYIWHTPSRKIQKKKKLQGFNEKATRIMERKKQLKQVVSAGRMVFGKSVAAFLRNCVKAVLGVFRVGILWKRKAYTGSLEK